MKHFYQILLLLLTLSGSADAQTTVNFTYTGAVQTWTVPSGVFALNIAAYGAAASNILNSGGGGGVVQATLAITPGQILNIYVGGKNDGYNGGGQLPVNKKGGGATDIRIGGTMLTDRVLVAGGGGGAGSGGGGGKGGGTTGGTSTLGFNNGGGGTQSAGGAGGGGASSGTLGFGGDGGTNGAGGGGGYYGGGGSQSSGGGGGSSYTNSSFTAVTHIQGQNTGSNGYLAITYTPPPPGAALSFDGTDDYAVVPSNSAFNVAQFSIETWLKWDRTAANIDFVCSKGFEQMEIHLNTNNSIRFIPTIGVILDAPAGTMPLGVWTHIACVYDPSGTGWAKMYIDGVEVALTNNGPNPITSPLINNSSPFYFGTRSPGYLLLQGQMDDIRIWNRALCQSEILVHKNCELAANEAGLVAYYKANQGTSFSPNTSITTLTDATSNALNATLTNFDLTGTSSNFVALSGVTTGTACSPLTFVEINLQSNSTNITDGSTTFSTTNNTDFGNISTLSLAKVYTIQNTGTGALTISSVTSSNASFAISGAPTTVATGGSATFTVTFTPTAVGSQTATIIVNSNDCNEGVYDFAVKCTALCASATLYVDANVTASGAGTSWASAYKTFDEALFVSQNCLVVSRINVAKGTYKPAKKPYDNGLEIVTSDARDVTFHIRSGLTVAGGYPNGGGTQNIANNETILSGDIGTVGDIADNTYHVVIASAGTIDGFTIRDGNANGSDFIVANNTYFQNYAGGLYAIGGTNIITNNTITNNICTDSGGGMVLFGSDINATVNNNIFTNNNAGFGGGAVYSYISYSNTISYNNNIFVGNSLNYIYGGTAIYMYNGFNTFNNNIIASNTSTYSSAAIRVAFANATLTNNTIVGNTSQGNAGATQFIGSTAALKNNIFRANTAAGNSSDILSSGSTLTFINNSMQNAASTYTLAAGSAGNIFEVNPLFVNAASPAGADGIYRTADDGLQLACGSPAINTGTNTGAPALDILGNAIFATTKDMGAYELQTTTTLAEINLQSNTTDILDGNTGFSTTNNTEFGNVVTTSPLAKVYTIQNTGTDALTISSVTSSNTLFAISGAPTTVAAGASATFTVTFSPIAAGVQTSTITVNNNDCDESVYDFAVQGTGADLCTSAAATLYVDANVAASGIGTSWTTAYKTFDEALFVSQKCPIVSRINVAKGTYKPTKKPYNNGVEIGTGDVRDVTFHIRSGLTVAGGYPNGGGTQDIANNATILNGDISTVGDIADNTYHVVITSAGTIDGFTIRDGNANAVSSITANKVYNRHTGGGLYAIDGMNTITNNTITNNKCIYYGGGMALSGTGLSATVNNNTFTNNDANLGGGGIYSFGSNANTISYDSNIFVRNSVDGSTSGSAIEMVGNGGFQTFSNNIVALNAPTNSSAAIRVTFANVTLTNNTIVGNTSPQGDAGATDFRGSTATLKNNIFRANTATGNSSDIYVSYSSTLTFINNSMQNTAGAYPLVVGSAGNIFAANPLFVNQASPAGADGIYRTADDGLQLVCGSPAVNTGTNTGAPALDILGNAIIGTTKDMGAYEQQTDCANTIYSGISACKSYTIDNVSGTNWFDIYGDNGIIASIRPNQDLGNVTLTIGDPAGTSSYSNNLFIGKDINITSTIAPTVGTNYDLKLYYYDAEFDTYKTAINMPSAAIADLNMAWAKGGTGCTLAAYASTATSNGTVNKANIAASDFGLPVTGGLNGFALQFSIDHFTMFAPTVISVGALPVKLIYFRGKNINKTNVLGWATANEQNNYGFDVQRSSDGQYFTTIGFVRGADNSSSVQNYTFNDYKVENGRTYYRLKQIDTDKRFEYSTLIALEMNEKTRVKIYPTPVNDNLIVEGAANFEIVNNLGQIVVQNTNGENTISLQQLQSGIYFVRGTDEDGANFIQKIIKE